uniref:Uncharacterized protein n=1 Tax=Anguilla anguilla TaxID=7936 RepID=A0A0E9RPA2_ANGAN
MGSWTLKSSSTTCELTKRNCGLSSRARTRRTMGEWIHRRSCSHCGTLECTFQRGRHRGY